MSGTITGTGGSCQASGWITGSISATTSPIFVAGLVFGLGVALLLFVLAVVPTTAMCIGSVVGGCALLGLRAAYVAPVRGR